MHFGFEVNGGGKLVVIQLLLILELLFDEVLVVSGVGDDHGAFSAFFDFYVHEGLEGGVDDQVDVLVLVQLHWELVVEGQIDYLLVVYPQSHQYYICVLVRYANLVELVPRKTHNASRIWGLLVEVCLLRGYLHA